MGNIKQEIEGWLNYNFSIVDPSKVSTKALPTITTQEFLKFRDALLKLVERAKIEEFEKMIKMDKNYNDKLKADQEKGIYPVSFGSASGALANAGWVNYFEDRIKQLKK